ncbi:hypothetical protein EDD17DRAFT_1512104 [Pisolithus thermaeus]|nr:hypothetical protein EDD17DRAFT_1512104 [Pisolithus thermaeus]
MLHLCDLQVATFLNPSPWSLFELDQELENARVLWRASKTGGRSTWNFASKRSPRISGFCHLRFNEITSEYRNRARRSKRHGVFETSEFLEGVGLVQECAGVGPPSNSADASGSDDGPDTQTNTSSHNHNAVCSVGYFFSGSPSSRAR